MFRGRIAREPLVSLFITFVTRDFYALIVTAS